MSTSDAFGYSCSHCFHIVQLRRWSKVWSLVFTPKMIAKNRKRPTHVLVHLFDDNIAYLSKLVKSFRSLRKICYAVNKEKEFLFFAKNLPFQPNKCKWSNMCPHPIFTALFRKVKSPETFRFVPYIIRRYGSTVSSLRFLYA